MIQRLSAITFAVRGWWAAIISTSQKQVSAATLESAKRDP